MAGCYSQLSKEIKKIADFIAVLNRIGVGDAVSFIKNLDLTKYTDSLLDNWGKLLHRLDTVLTTAKSKLGNFLPRTYVERLDNIRDGLATLKIKGGKMIPESVKEFQLRLKAIQGQMYKGDWHEIPNTLKSSTREIEARLVASAGKKWVAQGMKFPPAKETDFIWQKGWPDLTEGQFIEEIKLSDGGILKKDKTIKAFSGPIRAVRLPAGTKIRRVIQPDSNPAGLWWSYELPKNGRTWREDFAVLENWNKNGVYVEFMVEEPGLLVWEGKVAGQLQNDVSKPNFGQYLEGGGTQILVDFTENPNNAKFREKVLKLEKKPTNWSDCHLNVNIPEKEVIAQHLKAQELAPKENLVSSTAARTLKFDSDNKTEVLK